jgi:ADP-heptose:LPS heptosyltransferase
MPEDLVAQIIEKSSHPILIVGGSEDRERGTRIAALCPDHQVINTCGELSLMQSASLVAQSATLLTGDTGMMHIAACFDVPMVSVWGNTVPALGMYPYYPNQPEKFSIHEVTDLSCRPCSKIGFQDCPKRHFNCMNLQNVEAIAQDLESRSGQTR